MIRNRLVAACLLAAPVVSQETGAAAKAEESARRSDRFAIVFNLGYGGDQLPKDKKAFEKLVVGIKRAHFNVVLCKWEDWRARICKKHRLQIFVDLLADGHHVYKNVAGARKLCESLVGNDTVYGYHVWSDNIANTYSGRSRDVKNVHAWDPKHAVYVGSYRMSRVNRVAGLDLLGYYDFHWKRGGHWGNLAKASRVAKSKNAFFLRYCDASPGNVGKGNRFRVGYTMATSVVFGLKGYMFHYGGGVIDPKTGKLDALGKDLQSVNAAFAAIGDELMRIGNPVAVHSSAVTRTAKDKPIEGAPAVPSGLTAVPQDHWLQVVSGEVLLGFFKDDKGRDVVALASHNAYQPQDVQLRFAPSVKNVSGFDRKKNKWRSLRVRDGALETKVAVSATELLRVER